MRRYATVIFITAIFIAFFAGLGYLYFWMFTESNFPIFFRLLVVLVTVVLVAALVKVGVERIREIYKGEEDDLGKY